MGDMHQENDVIYEPLPEAELKKETDALIGIFSKYAKESGFEPSAISIERPCLPLILQRVDKRRRYFYYFHERMEMNEIKRAALVAYWVLKLRPFSYRGNEQDGWQEELQSAEAYKAINEGFAAFYILSACQGCAKLQGVPPRAPSKELLLELAYAFKYWDLSKEAVIMIAETIGEAYFGIPVEGMRE